MPTIEKRTTLRLPEDLLERLRVQAQQCRRSWNGHVIYLLEVAEAQEREWLDGEAPSASSS
jgi:predicted DNA-binding protein